MDGRRRSAAALASSLSINVSKAPSASPSLWNSQPGSALHCSRNVVSTDSKPAACRTRPSVRSIVGSVAPSSTAARTVSGNNVAHVAPSSRCRS